MKGMTRKSRIMRIRHIVSIPLIISVLVPFIILDIWIEIYHRICFPLYGMPRVRRSRYILIDRYKLSYLNAWKKITCAYCGYINGLLSYWVKIVGDTEEYRCGVQHEDRKKNIIQKHQASFVVYGDEKKFQKRYGKKI